MGTLFSAGSVRISTSLAKRLKLPSQAQLLFHKIHRRTPITRIHGKRVGAPMRFCCPLKHAERHLGVHLHWLHAQPRTTDYPEYPRR